MDAVAETETAAPLLDSARPQAAVPDHFQVFGERRTGTNFLAALVARSTDLRETTRYGWKHGFPSMPCIAREGLILVILREPFGWLSSLHNRPFAHSHEGLPFDRFLRTPWVDVFVPKHFGHARWGYGGMERTQGVVNQFDRHPFTGAPFATPMEMRTLKTRGFLSFLGRDCNAAVVDYDTLAARPAEVLAALSERFGFALKGPVEPPERVGARGRDRARVTREAMTEADRAFLLDGLDRELEARCGYGWVFDDA